MDARKRDALRAEFEAVCEELTEEKLNLLTLYALKLIAEENGK